MATAPAASLARTGVGPAHGVGPTASLLAALGRAGLERVGWFEFGLMAPAGAPWLAGRDDLLLRDASGSSLWQESPGLNRVWLNPILPEVQQVLEDLVVDACTQLPLEAIQLDDHLGYPVRFGYDPATLAAWRATEAGRRNPSPAPGEPAWIAWRAEQVTALLERLRAAMNSACPAVRISVSPNPQEFSYSNYLADWSSWVRRGLVDEVVVQIYRDNLAALGRELAHPSLADAMDHGMSQAIFLCVSYVVNRTMRRGIAIAPFQELPCNQLADAPGTDVTGLRFLQSLPPPTPSFPFSLLASPQRRQHGTNLQSEHNCRVT